MLRIDITKVQQPWHRSMDLTCAFLLSFFLSAVVCDLIKPKLVDVTSRLSFHYSHYYNTQQRACRWQSVQESRSWAVECVIVYSDKPTSVLRFFNAYLFVLPFVILLTILFHSWCDGDEWWEEENRGSPFSKHKWQNMLRRNING